MTRLAGGVRISGPITSDEAIRPRYERSLLTKLRVGGAALLLTAAIAACGGQANGTPVKVGADTTTTLPDDMPKRCADGTLEHRTRDPIAPGVTAATDEQFRPAPDNC